MKTLSCRGAAGPCSTSGRSSSQASRRLRFTHSFAARHIVQAVRHQVRCKAVAEPAEIKTESVSEDESRYAKVALAVEARLNELYTNAPDDAELQDFTEDAMNWDEDELLAEGEALQLQRLAASPTSDPLAQEVRSEAKPQKEKIKPAPKTDPNVERKRQGRRLVISEVPIDFLPKIAIIGRPNVGKSALFNRIAGKAAAIVYDTPGVTRDRLYHRSTWGNREFVLIDTGGLMSSAARLPEQARDTASTDISEAGLPSAIERQAAAGVAEADVVVLVCDGQAGPVASEDEIVAWLRRQHPSKKVVLAVNKCESSTQGELLASTFWGHGLEPLPVSAISGTGTGELMDRIMDALPPLASTDEKEREVPLAMAIVGRPNVGKSSMVNAISGTNRAIVSNMSGTTRDAVDTEVILPDGTPLKLIDTAGIRKRAKVASSDDGAEAMSVVRAIRAVRRADVVALMMDASSGITVQDFRIAELAANEGCAVVLVMNKWDKVKDKTSESMKLAEQDVKQQLRQVSWAKTVFTCATNGKNVHKVLNACILAGEQHAKRVSTATLNMVVQESLMWKSPPSIRGTIKKPRIYYATQAAVRPPTFLFFCNDGRLIGDDYKRYLERSLRESVDLEGTPIRLFFRGKASDPNKRAES